MFNTASVKTCVAMAALLVSTASIADPVIYETAASFAAVTTGAGVDTFDDLPNGLLSNVLDRRAGTYTYQAVASAGSPFFGAGSSGGWLSTNDYAATIKLTGFSDDVDAVGGYFFGSGYSSEYQLGSISVYAEFSNGVAFYTIADASTSSFLGFASPGGVLRTLKISAVQTPDVLLWPTLDNLTLARVGTPPVTAVPEAESHALMMLGLGSLWMVARRRRRNG